MKKNIKKEKEKVKNSKKITTTQKIEKRGAKEEQYLEEHIESTIWAVFTCAYFHLVPNQTSDVHIT